MAEIKQITAEEFLLRQGCVREDKTFFTEVEAVDLIEFAKIHVKAALKAKIEAMQEHMNGGYSLDEIDGFTYNAYPLDKIL
jgi:hypothetical protein